MSARTGRVSYHDGLIETVWTHSIVSVDVRYSPIRVLRIVAYAHAPPLFHGVIKTPGIEVLFRELRLIREGIQLLYPSNLASPRPNTVVDVSRLGFVCKVEADECEVPAAEANRRRLS